MLGCSAGVQPRVSKAQRALRLPWRSSFPELALAVGAASKRRMDIEEDLNRDRESDLRGRRRPRREGEDAPLSEPEWMSALMLRLTSSVMTSIQAELRPLKVEVASLRKDHLDLEARVQALEVRGSSPASRSSGPLSSVGSHGSTRMPSSASTMVVTMPAVLKLRGFCDFGTWRESGVKREEAEPIVGALVGSLPISLRSEVGQFELFGVRNFEVTIPLKRAGVLNEIKRYWQDKLSTDDSLRFRGRVLYVVPQRSEEDRPKYAAMGRVKEELSRRVAALGQQPAWELDFFWQPKWKIMVRDRARLSASVQLAELTAAGVWRWDEERLQMLLGVTSQVLQTSL